MLRPLLVSRELATANSLVFRPLFDFAPESAPVIVLVEDDEPVDEDRLQTLGVARDEAFDDAIESLRSDVEGALGDEPWAHQSVPVKGGLVLDIAARAGGEATTEDVLVPAVMNAASELLGGGPIALAIPARGILLATLADQKWQLVAAFSAAARLHYEKAGEAAVSAGLLRVENGEPVTIIELTTASLDAAVQKQRNGQLN